MKERFPILPVVAFVLMLVVLTVVAGSQGAGSEAGPGGTLALRRFLASMGRSVEQSDRLPPPGATLVLLADLRGEQEAQRLLRWVDRGGRLVLAQPRSVTARQAGVADVGLLGEGDRSVSLRPGCAAPVGLAARQIVVESADLALRALDPRSIACFPAAQGSFLVTTQRGQGSVAVLGGQSPLVNAHLLEAHNPRLALALLGDRREVVFGPALATGAEAPRQGVWEALPGPAKAVVIQIVLATLVFAAVRARRLGRPVLEEPISPIPAGELVRATARLYQNAQAAPFAADLMRRGARRRLARRFGLPAGSDPSVLLDSAGAEGSRVHELLSNRKPAGDEELLEIGRKLESAVREAALRR
ncbi:MAG: DUF4350 domain-containing protein [Actinomycetota bacterium]